MTKVKIKEPIIHTIEFASGEEVRFVREDDHKRIVGELKDALGEIQSSPTRDFAENWNAEQWAKFYKQDIDKLKRVASAALYEVKI